MPKNAEGHWKGLEEFANSLFMYELKEGGILFQAGDYGTSMYAIATGKLTCLNKDGLLMPFTLETGTILGELAALQNRTQKRLLTMKAVCHTVLYELPSRLSRSRSQIDLKVSLRCSRKFAQRKAISKQTVTW